LLNPRSTESSYHCFLRLMAGMFQNTRTHVRALSSADQGVDSYWLPAWLRHDWRLRVVEPNSKKCGGRCQHLCTENAKTISFLILHQLFWFDSGISMDCGRIRQQSCMCIWLAKKNTHALQRDPIHMRIELRIIVRYELLAEVMRPCQVRDTEDVTQYILESNFVFIVIDESRWNSYGYSPISHKSGSNRKMELSSI
jgi:hypothetical protein